MGRLPVDIEAPFAFGASISRRARVNLVAICLNDGCKFVMRWSLRFDQDRQSGVLLLLPAGLDPLHAPKDEYAQTKHPSAEKKLACTEAKSHHGGKP